LILEGKKIPVFGDGLYVRDWLYVEDHCRAIWTVANRGQIGQVYNIGTGHRITNRDLTEHILRLIGRDESHIENVKDRPGHDLRYAIDSSKLRQEFGWQPEVDFVQGLAQTVAWYQSHEAWWRPLKAGAHEWYQKNYIER